MLLWEPAGNVAAADVILHHRRGDGGGTRPAGTACMTHLNVQRLSGLPACTQTLWRHFWDRRWHCFIIHTRKLCVTATETQLRTQLMLTQTWNIWNDKWHHVFCAAPFWTSGAVLSLRLFYHFHPFPAQVPFLIFFCPPLPARHLLKQLVGFQTAALVELSHPQISLQHSRVHCLLLDALFFCT